MAKGEDTLTVLWDMEKFYDNICITRLIREACRLRYPMLVLRLGIVMHMASRLLRTYRFIPGIGAAPKWDHRRLFSEHSLC